MTPRIWLTPKGNIKIVGKKCFSIKKWFRPAKGTQSTLLLVKTHNKRFSLSLQYKYILSIFRARPALEIPMICKLSILRNFHGVKNSNFWCWLELLCNIFGYYNVMCKIIFVQSGISFHDGLSFTKEQNLLQNQQIYKTNCLISKQEWARPVSK